MKTEKFEIRITDKLATLLQCVSKDQAVEVFDILTYFPNICCDYKPFSRDSNQLFISIIQELERQLYDWKHAE